LLGSAEQAQASKLSVIVIAEAAEDRGTALRLSKALAQKLARSQDLTEIDITESLDPEVVSFRTQDIQDGLVSAKTGLKALDQLDLETAGADLDMSVNLLLGYLDHLDAGEREVLNQSVFALATVSMFEGNTETADAIFVALTLLSPSYSPEVDGYAENVTKRYRSVRTGLEKRATGVVEVRSTPPGAAVYVDGNYQGLSPIKVEDLVDGQHAVLLERLGYITHGTLTPVVAGRVSSVEVDLAPTKGIEVLKTIDVNLVNDEQALLQFGKRLGVQKLAVLNLRSTVSGPSVVGVWQDIETGKLLAKIPQTRVVNEPGIAADTILAVIASTSDPFGKKNTEESNVSAMSFSFAPLMDIEWKKLPDNWWFWAGVAGVVGAAAVGTGLAVSSNNDSTLPPRSEHILGF